MTRILVTPDNLTPLLRVAWDQPELPVIGAVGVGGAGTDTDMLSTQDSCWLRKIAFSGWKDLKLHFAEMEALRCRAEAGGLGTSAFPLFEKRLAILKTILQMQQLLGMHYLLYSSFPHLARKIWNTNQQLNLHNAGLEL